MSDVSVLGTGLLGGPIARRLATTGNSVTVWNRTREKAEALSLPVADSPRAAFEASAVAILMLADAPAIEAVLAAAGDAVRGKTIVQMGTISPAETLAFAASVAAAGGDWVEAPVLGSIPQAETGTLQVMVGGSGAQLAKLTPILSLLGPLHHAGEVGKAAALKLALNQLIGTLTATFATSLAYVRATDVPTELFLAILRESALHAPTFDKKLPRMLASDYSNPTFPAKHLLKDLRLVEHAFREAGLGTDLIAAVNTTLERTLELGHAESDYSALAEAITNPRKSAGGIPESTREVLRASVFHLENEPYVWVKARSVPRAGKHLMVSEDDLDITVVTHEKELAHVEVEARNADLWALLSIDCANPFYCVGFLTAIASELTAAGIDLLALSAFTRDLIFVKDGDRRLAREALLRAGISERIA